MSVPAYKDHGFSQTINPEAPILHQLAPGPKEEAQEDREVSKSWHDVRVHNLARFTVHAADADGAIADTMAYCAGMPGMRIPSEALVPDNMIGVALGPEDRGFNNHVLGDPVRLKELRKT